MAKITFTQMGQGSVVLEVEDGTSLACLKSMVNANPDLTIMLRGEKVDDDYEVADGDSYVAVGKPKHGNK